MVWILNVIDVCSAFFQYKAPLSYTRSIFFNVGKDITIVNVLYEIRIGLVRTELISLNVKPSIHSSL